IRRERPSTPSAPIWLDPSGCPPDGSFVFGDISAAPLDENRLSGAALAYLQPPATPPCRYAGLTVDWKENPAFYGFLSISRLAPLSQRTFISREHPGGQDCGSNLARSVAARSLAARFCGSHRLARSHRRDLAARRNLRSGASDTASVGGRGWTSDIDCFDRPR